MLKNVCMFSFRGKKLCVRSWVIDNNSYRKLKGLSPSPRNWKRQKLGEPTQLVWPLTNLNQKKLLLLRVTLLKIKTFYKIKSRIVNMKEGKNVNTQAEIQASAICHMRDIRGNDVPKFKEVCVGRPETYRICHWVVLLTRKFIAQGIHKH